MILPSEYKILERIGSNGSTPFFRAERYGDRKKVIVKVPEGNHTTREPDGIIRQYAIASTLSFSKIAQFLKSEFFNEKLIAIFEDIPGISLEEYLEGHAVHIDEGIKIAIEIAEILQYLNEKGIVHYNLSPASFLIRQDGTGVCLLDLSITTRDMADDRLGAQAYSMSSSLLYVAPEQTGRITGGVDIRSNLYSLGILMYRMFTGSVPFTARDALSIIHSHIAKQPVPVHVTHPHIPVALSLIIQKLLSKNPTERYQSPFGLKADLHTCLSQWGTGNGNVVINELGEHDFSGILQNINQFYGREQELITLDQAYKGAVAGKNEIVFIEGSSGIGKSALVQKFKESVLLAETIFIQGKFNQFQKNVPYFGFIEALKEFVDRVLAKDNEEIIRWREDILKAVGSNGQLLTDIIPHLESLIGPQGPLPELGPKENRNRFYYVFLNFLRCICSAEHPLVLFFDDLQWADAASMNLLKVISTTNELQSLLFIGAYRNNEIASNSAFSDMKNSMKESGLAPKIILLNALPVENAQSIVLETVNGRIQESESLIKLVYGKSKGNPFFIKAFLSSLYTENILTFDYMSLGWSLDFSKIGQLKFGHSIVELMTGRLQKLPESTQHVLRYAACLGYQFDVQLVMILLRQTRHEISESLNSAVDEGLVSSIGENYCFTHDRIQQAAYSLIEPGQRAYRHLEIGTTLLREMDTDSRNRYIFEIVHQLNAGAHVIVEKEELLRLAELNLAAGIKAKSSAAYNSSFEYLQSGIRFLPVSEWKDYYELALQLYTEGVESAFIIGNIGTMNEWIDAVLLHAYTVLDKVKVYEVKIKFYISIYKQFEAVQTALEVLALLGIRFPAKPNKFHITMALLQIKRVLLGKTKLSLKDLPFIKDVRIEAAIRILVSVGSAVVFSPALFALMACKAFLLLARFGNTAYSGHICSGYGMVVLKGLGNIKSGYDWGDVAMQLSDKYEINSVKCSTRFLVTTFFLHWRQHLKKSLQPLLNNYWFGLENGNIEFASYSALDYSQNAFFCGRNLRDIVEENGKFYERFPSLRNEYAFNMHNVCSQATLNLFELVDNPTILTGKVHDEERMIGTYRASKGNRELFKIYLYKLILAYLFEKYDEASQSALEAEHRIKSALGNPEVSIFRFYQALTILQLLPRYTGLSRKKQVEKVNSNLVYYEKLASLAPANCLHKLLLIKAELCNAVGKVREATLLYNEAIQKALENDYPNDLALVYEAAAKFYLYRHKDLDARRYMLKAYEAYQQWGAFNKVKDLEKRYAYLLNINQSHEDTGSVSLDRKLQLLNEGLPSIKGLHELDLQTILKAAAAISSEVELDRLLKKLIRIAVESAGAQEGCLILNRESDYYIEAKSSVDEAGEVTLESVPVGGNNSVSESIVKFVAATRENLVVGDAIRHPHFYLDPVIIAKRSRSVLCMPIMQQGKIMCLLYLENNLLTDAFTQERVALLSLLSGQMAISLQNALNEEKKINAFIERENLMKQINLHQQELLKTKLEIQEQTYRNISEELHDNVGQLLSLIKINISTIDLNSPDVAKAKLAESKALLAKVIQDTRDLSRAMNTEQISQVGLDNAISQQLQFLNRTGVYQTHLTIRGEVSRYDSQSELVVFRIVQELINNVVKHANASSINILMDYQNDKLSILVHDDGRGFDIQEQQLSGNKGIGLRNIHNRIALIEGRVLFESGHQKGTTVTIELYK